MSKTVRIAVFIGFITVLAIIMVYAAMLNKNAGTGEIRPGDHILLGKYNDKPILWVCIDVTDDGPLMLSDRILSFKAFDAAGRMHKYSDGSLQEDQGQARTINGSNLWETSNIRAWLNSSEQAGQIVWPDGCPPFKDKVFNGENSYSGEAGFLADSNFSDFERKAIKPVAQKTVLSEEDKKLATTGTEEYITKSDVSDIYQNFDSAYGYDVTDMMFLLDSKQAQKLFQNKNLNKYHAKPTLEALRLNDDINSGQQDSYYAYWLRTPDTILHPSLTLTVYADTKIAGRLSNESNGIRPAFYLNVDMIRFSTGSGTKTDPYIPAKQ